MKKILVPTDFSDNAADALIYAVNLFNGTPAKLKVIHVVDPNKLVSLDPSINSLSMKVDLDEAGSDLKKLEESTRSYCQKNGIQGIDLTFELFSGMTVQSIKSLARTENIDLIIIGSRGESHSRIEKIFGTVSSDILQNAPCSVLIIPKGYRFEVIDNVIYGTKLNHDDPYELWKAIQILKPHSPVIRCVHIMNKEQEVNRPEISQFAKYLIEHSPSMQTTFYSEVGENPEQILNEYAEIYNADMIIMYREKRSLWGDLFQVKHTNRMLRIATRPLFVVNH